LELHFRFYIRNLGFMTPTEARRISFGGSLCFERIHEETYQKFGFNPIFIEPGSILDRAETIIKMIGDRTE